MCSNCKVIYYGKTYRHFTRAAERVGISYLTWKRLKCVKRSAVSGHLLECNCSTDSDHFDILASDANKFRLLIKESVLISPSWAKSSTFWLWPLLIDFVRVGMMLWNIETDEKSILVELYQFLNIFNSSDDGLLVRVKRQKF